MDLLRISEPKLRKIRGGRIAMIFQEPMTSLNPVYTAGYQVMEAILLHQKIGKEEARRKTIELFHEVGIPNPSERIHMYPHEMSGGQRQRVAIGRAIVRSPQVFLFDEPLSNLDAALRVNMRVFIMQLHQQLDATMIYVTHDQTEALTFADQVVVMNLGEVVQAATPVELFERPQHTFVGHFIGSPGMNVLPCEVRGGKALFAGIPVEAANIQAASSRGRAEIGVRPEFVSIAKSGIAAEVVRVADAGRYRIVEARSHGHTIKLLLKEVVVPSASNKWLFRIAPAITLVPAFAAWAVMPLDPNLVIADIDAGLLYVLSLTSVGVYGVILAGWAANSKYAFLGAMRSAAQVVAYEIAMGFALVGVVMAAGTLNLGDIVRAQAGGVSNWFLIWLFPLFVVYLIAGVAETNRAPFDVAEGESEIVAGFHVEYSGIAFALFFLAEYANMILISALTAVFFLGGWLSPFEGLLAAGHPLAAPGFHWLFLKLFFFLTCFMWYRATFPRYRYDQIMRLGWKVLIPVTLVWIAVEGLMVYWGVGPWKN